MYVVCMILTSENIFDSPACVQLRVQSHKLITKFNSLLRYLSFGLKSSLNTIIFSIATKVDLRIYFKTIENIARWK